ncbi:MAG TPA: endopeptidase La [Solirubrobacteraceae bacterium]|nr:endopeptidase La [Solirubrobacteraceae bacterium]
MIEVGVPSRGPRDVAVSGTAQLPQRVGVLPLRDTVTFPDMLIPLNVGQERSIELINDVLRGDRSIAMVASANTEAESPGPEDLYSVGVLGVVARMIRVPDGTLRVLIQGGQRVRIENWLETEPYLVAEVAEAPDVVDHTPELTALMRNVQQTFTDIVEQVPYLPEELQIMVANVDDPSVLAHLIAGALRLKTEEKEALLEEVDVGKRLRRLSEILARELEVVTIGSKIQSQVQSELDKGQREYFLRQQLKAIQEELGEADEMQAEITELREQLDSIELPEEVRKQSDRELSRLERLQPAMAEYGVVRGYLEWIAALPWDKSTEDNLDLKHARKVLDEDHYDIEQVKDRILEFLAVRTLKPDARGTILCFVGPPGVGKTSLGRSIARALGRKFERISVGGVRDEAEIRGHRRTYIGAMPGTIIRAMRDAGAKNPLLMIDEIDKMGADFRGDPSSAMLEVLDPEQNHSFRDHYLDLPFDLSAVTFVTTANTLDTIPGPLRDRMEVIQLAGYTEEEKLQIAKRYLVPRQIERNGLTKSKIAFSDPALRVIISDYTREAGVRQLEREIGAACRKVARRVAEGTAKRKVTVTEPRIRELLGRPRFFAEVRRRTSRPGVATGLAWTPAGGDVLFVEATAMPGKGGLTITGQLGDVMKESASAALSYVRSNATELFPDLDEDWFGKHDIHIHVPAGAIPKDGPSAGVTMATALSSLLSRRPVRSDVAMTGEITLTGQVLPIGGLKEKALAAQRGGIHVVIAPARNEQDIDEIPEHLRKDLEFVFVSEIGEVLEVALQRRRAPRPRGVARRDGHHR